MMPPWAAILAIRAIRNQRVGVAARDELDNIRVVEFNSSTSAKKRPNKNGRSRRARDKKREVSGKSGMERVAQSLLLDGPASARTLAKRLGVTPAAVRRHLDALAEANWVSYGPKPAYGPSAVSGRGRPARVYSLNGNGRRQFAHSYDHIALEALDALYQTGGEGAIEGFAKSRADALLTRISSAESFKRASGVGELANSVTEVLNHEGYAATVAPARGPIGGLQLCQHNCPVEAVAGRYQQICEHETKVLGEALGVHVTRIATIAAGDGVCTTMIPDLDSKKKPPAKMKETAA